MRAAPGVSEGEIHDQFIKQNTKVKFDYAVLKQDDIKKGLHPADAELKAFYESHKQSYANSIPEKRKVKYALVETARSRRVFRLLPTICERTTISIATSTALPSR